MEIGELLSLPDPYCNNVDLMLKRVELAFGHIPTFFNKYTVVSTPPSLPALSNRRIYQ
jgi:hypothetical protein